ncbi:zinc ribbon domain-containing protein [Myxococcota bacterium]|nr:zinc ribbon domain-containing protein [Myxococcota bacterium]
MPVYEYACGKCESEFEVEQRITEDPLKTCPKCRSRKVKRLISRTSFVLKGGGWYADAYSSSSESQKSESESSETKSSSSSDDKAEKSDKSGKSKDSSKSVKSKKSSGSSKGKDAA